MNHAKSDPEDPWRDLQKQETQMERPEIKSKTGIDGQSTRDRPASAIEETQLEAPQSSSADSAESKPVTAGLPEEHSVTMWLSSLQTGDGDAAAGIWQRFYSDLVRRVGRRMQSSPVRDADADDVVQEAFHTFFRRAEAGQFPDLNDRDDLWKLLVTLTERKALNQIRGARAQKRGGGDLRGESIFLQAADGNAGGGFDRIANANVTPEDAALIAESFGDLIEMLNPDQRLMAIYKLEGRTNEEIARLLDCALATVERRLNLIRRKWSEAGVGPT